MEWLNEALVFVNAVSKNLGIGFTEVFKLQTVTMAGVAMTLPFNILMCLIGVLLGTLIGVLPGTSLCSY